MSRPKSPTARADEASGRHEDPPEVTNPKLGPAVSNQIKDPEEWVTGHEPMTGAQASYLKTLTEEAHEPELYDPELDKAEASKRIDQLRAETGRDGAAPAKS
ncbi:DUF3072 domain-containing protein [Microvirga antarctica]|uniref:DUF3072 domain-containing protein n=1 Tax=Microvirga antarctica TaxID=2819233 RepID=UPI003CCE8935